MKVFKDAIEKALSKERFGRCDFHTHSFFSDGVLLPIEQLRRAHVFGHEIYAITDHASESNLDVITKITKDCKLALKHWGIVALPGVELTHVPVEALESCVEKARAKGALIVVIHGETISEPVEQGTNLQAASINTVNILAHPGILTKEEAQLCRKNNVFVEITSNPNHGLTNGRTAKIGLENNAHFILNTDSHSPMNMLDANQATNILLGAGFSESDLNEVLQNNIRLFLSKILEQF